MFLRSLMLRRQLHPWWRFQPTAATQPYRVFSRWAYPFAQQSLAGLDPRVAASFAAYQREPQQSFVYWYREPTLLEPQYGFAVRGARTLIPESMSYYERVGVPATMAYLRRRVGARVSPIHVPVVVSLREFGDHNYYHFYSDVLGKLALLEQCGISADLPLLISPTLASKPYFQAALRRGALGERRWIVHRDLIAADEVIWSKTLPHERATFAWMRRAVQAPPADPHGTERIFLTRSSARGRVLANADQVTAACAERGFRAVDADQLDLDAQIELFRRTRWLVGIHGAGLVNSIYRAGQPLDLLELFPPDNIPPHYFWLSANHGFGYRAVVGTASAAPGVFHIDVAQLRAQLDALLAAHA